MSLKGTLLQQAEAGLPEDLRSRYFDENATAGVHLAIMREPFLSFLLAGSKTIESRFSVNRVDPFNRVVAGDLVLLKAGGVVGAFVVGAVDSKHLAAGQVDEIRSEFNTQIQANDEFWEVKADARFATLLEVAEIFTFPAFGLDKRDMRGWVVLREYRDEMALIW